MHVRIGLAVLRPVLAAGLAGCFSTAVSAAPTPITASRIVSGLARPVFVTQPPGETQRLFIVEQRGADNRGRIKILTPPSTTTKTFLTTALVATGNEQGLLGMAFDPDYANNGRFYIHLNDSGGTTRVYRHFVTANPDSAQPTGTLIYSVAQPFTNHNGGWMAFGPDGYLWLALGDGGSANDPGDRAQNRNVALGKLLRFDVSGNGVAVAAPDNPYIGAIPGLDEVFCTGLRNPWRNSFDRETGDLIIADVGQNNIEEIDFAPADSARGKGWNWGWRCYEGNTLVNSSTTNPCMSCASPGCPLKFPAYVYSHSGGRCSVTGGYVYRGCAIPDLRGTYFFADYCTAEIWSGKFVNNMLTGVTLRDSELDPPGGTSIDFVSSFGEDSSGELYICDQTGGEVYKIIPNGVVPEANAAALRTTTIAGDSLGSSAKGNALTPGVTLFTDPGSRIRGVGYLKDATLLECVAVTGTTLQSKVRLGVWNVDVTAIVNPDSSTLTRSFVFTNTSAVAQELAFVDVIAPYLSSDDDRGGVYGETSHGESALVTISEAIVSAKSGRLQSGPAVWVTGRGLSLTATLSTDVDSVNALEARVAADEPLSGRTSVGPTRAAMAIGFEFGSLAAGASDSAVVVTKILKDAPTAVEGEPRWGMPELAIKSSMPFARELRLALHLPQAGSVTLDVFDVRGRHLRRLLDGNLTAGTHAARWDGRDHAGRALGAGLYLVRLRTPSGTVTERVVRVAAR